MNWRRNIFFLIFSFALFYLVLRNVPIQSLGEQFKRAEPISIGLVGIILLTGSILRAWRWQLMLHSLGYRPTVARATIAILVGNLASMVIPGAGELTRCGSLERMEAVPTAKGLGSVVAERLVDLVMLAVMVLVLFLLEFNRLSEQLSRILLTRLQQSLTSVWFWVGVLVLAVSIWIVLRLMKRFVATRFGAILQQFKQGFSSLRAIPNPGLYVLLTVFIYLIALVATYITFWTTPALENLSLRIAFSILTVSSLGGLAVPTQAGVGTFHALTQFVLIQYGFTASFGAVTATYIHAILYGLTLVLSLFGFLVLAVRFNAKTQST